jgi:hypothetical protein
VANKPAPPVKKKKIAAYPFAVTVELNAVKKNLEVIHLTPMGFLAKLKGTIVHVGQHYKSDFELPVLHDLITSQVRVMKTYDRSLDPKQHLVERMAEFQFETLTSEGKKSIVAFLSAIGQK